jgi:hypothetical protein
MIAVQSRLADANAAANNLVRRPLMTGEANTQLQGVANRFSQGVKPGESATTTAEGYADALRKSAAAGGESKAPTSSRTKYEAMGTDAGIGRIVTNADKLAAGGIQGAGKVANKVGTFIADVMTVKEMNANLKTRDEGTLGKTGQVFEPQDFIGKVAKGEMVLTPEQAKKFMEGAKTEGIADAVKNLGGMMPGSAKGSDGGGFSLSSLSKEISTSVSSVTSGSTTTRSVQNDDSKAASKELANVKEQYAAERQALLEKTKAQLGPDAGPRQLRTTMRDSDEGKAIEEKYKALKAPLYKQIEEGIRWETETKAEQVEETKTFVKEQAEILKVSNSDLLTIAAMGSTEKLDIEKESLIEAQKIAELRLIGIQQGAEAEENAKKESVKLLTSAAVGSAPVKPPITTGIDAKATAPVAPKFDKSKFTMPSMDQLTIGPDGMPKISAKPQAQTIPAAVKAAEKQASSDKKINEETGEEYSPTAETKKTDKKTAATETKTATLDDVAKLLTSLNTTMKQIASAASETNNKLGQQVKATKAMSGNLHGAP